MGSNKAGEPPSGKGQRAFSAADSTEQKLRAEAALSREELQETVAELVRRTDVRSTVRNGMRRRAEDWRTFAVGARDQIVARDTLILVMLGITTVGAFTVAVVRSKQPCHR